MAGEIEERAVGQIDDRRLGRGRPHVDLQPIVVGQPELERREDSSRIALLAALAQVSHDDVTTVLHVRLPQAPTEAARLYESVCQFY